MSLGDQVIVMDRGRIMQQGSPTEIYARPANKFVAEFVGRSNWFAGRLGGEASPGVCLFETTNGVTLRVPALGARTADAYEVCVRPERITVLDGAGEPDPTRGGLNALWGTVTDAASLGGDVHLFVRLESGQRVAVVEKNLGQPLRSSGQVVTLRFRPQDCIVVPADR
jgi:putative spermidine/putrescine transport system ATP-binding protein/putrescine transport system ATP-binding protein